MARKTTDNHISYIQLLILQISQDLQSSVLRPTSQPYWAWADKFITELTIPKLGEERSQWLYPIKSLLDSGALVVLVAIGLSALATLY